MQGALVRSGSREDYTALGETGQPVIRSATQLREVIRREAKRRRQDDASFPQMERHLAIPHRDQRGERIDWYSDDCGSVTPWGEASEPERESARAQLRRFESFVYAFSEASLQSAGGAHTDRNVMGHLLRLAIHTPDEHHTYLVNGVPVLTFWGFQHANTRPAPDPLHFFYPKATSEPEAIDSEPEPETGAEPEPEPEPEPEAEPLPREETTAPARRRFLWSSLGRWPWLLAGLLLALLLLFLLRACSPGLGGLGNGFGSPGGASQGSWSMPSWSMPSWSMPSFTANETSMPAGVGQPQKGSSSTLGLSGQPLPSGEPAPTSVPFGGLPGLHQGSASLPSNGGGISAMDLSAAAPDLPRLDPLTIPPGLENGVAEFMDGDWRAAGVVDKVSGRPLRVSYAFEKGTGLVNIQRRRGNEVVPCSGPVDARMNDQTLAIVSEAGAICQDGSQYDMPEVLCATGTEDLANCAVSYANESFPMQMWKISE